LIHSFASTNELLLCVGSSLRTQISFPRTTAMKHLARQART
jgi:hypothetical protein